MDNVAANVIRLDTPLDAAFFEQVVDVQGGNDAGSATVAPNGATLVWSDPRRPRFVRARLRAPHRTSRRRAVAPRGVDRGEPDPPPVCLAPDVAAPARGQYRGPVEIARLDESFLELKKGDHEALRAIRFVRGQALHLSSQLEEDFSDDRASGGRGGP